MNNFDQAFFEIIALMESAKLKIDALRNAKAGDGRALSIAVTELETSMLWVANARP